MATYSSILAWRVLWTEEPRGLQSMGSQDSDMTDCFHPHGATRDYPTKRSNSESQRQTPYDITYMWNRKYGINEHTHQKETDSQT